MDKERRPYSAYITRKSPSAIAFLVDRSASMGEHILFGRDNITKAEAVARIINCALTEIGMRCRRMDGIYNYFDVAVIGYGDNECQSLLEESVAGSDTFVPIAALEAAIVPQVSYRILFNDAKEQPSQISAKEYITPHASGNTPMLKAIKYATTQLKGWIKEHGKDSFPPIVIHITDGMAVDGNSLQVVEAARKLTSLSTSDGNLLLFNINLTRGSMQDNLSLFPISRDSVEPLGEYASMLYDISSELPHIFHERIAKIKGVHPQQVLGARALGYNMRVTDFLKLISIGSMSVNMIR